MMGDHARILAADDDPQALRYVRDALASAGYTPVVTGDPVEALRLVAEEKPDLVLFHPGNANLRFDGFAAQDILGALQPVLAASTGAACTSGIPEPSHVLSAMGLRESEADSSARFSFGRFTSNLEIQDAATLVTKALESLVETGAAPCQGTEKQVLEGWLPDEPLTG